MANELLGQEQQYGQVTARLPIELFNRFEAICDASFRSKSATIQMLIEQYCDELEALIAQGK